MRQEKPSMVCHYQDFAKAGGKQRLYLSGEIAHLLRDELRQLPALIMSVLVQRAAFEPGFSGGVRESQTFYDLNTLVRKQSHETLLRPALACRRYRNRKLVTGIRSRKQIRNR
jgi:hypothetical protein